jgi:hypothetical protein
VVQTIAQLRSCVILLCELKESRLEMPVGQA